MALTCQATTPEITAPSMTTITIRRFRFDVINEPTDFFMIILCPNKKIAGHGSFLKTRDYSVAVQIITSIPEYQKEILRCIVPIIKNIKTEGYEKIFYLFY